MSKVPLKYYFSYDWLNQTFPSDQLASEKVLDHARKNANQIVKDEKQFITRIDECIKEVKKDRYKNTGYLCYASTGNAIPKPTGKTIRIPRYKRFTLPSQESTE